ncbi:MAG: UDP-N-acetylglucosamine--LPS N-acetylglucosamine transferase [Pseudomonadota bacterium]
MAIASGGGHWVQLRRIRNAWQDAEVTYVTTDAGYRDEVVRDSCHAKVPDFFVVPDANRWNKFRLVQQLAAIFVVLLRVRPDIVVTTGAAPGYFAVRLGRYLGIRSIWIDSIANADELSLSGQKAARHADLCLTQWKHLARPEGPHFWGSVL